MGQQRWVSAFSLCDDNMLTRTMLDFTLTRIGSQTFYLSTFSVPGKEVLLTLSTTVQSNLNDLQSNLKDLPEITASLVTHSSSYSSYVWDVLQANLGMPILILRSLSFYVLFLCLLTVIPGFLNVASGEKEMDQETLQTPTEPTSPSPPQASSSVGPS